MEDEKQNPSGSEDEQDPRASSSSLTVENVRLHTEQSKKKRSDSASSKESQSLGPLKTATSTARSSIVSDITASNADDADLQLPKTKPLPPIGVTDDIDEEEEEPDQSKGKKGSRAGSAASSVSSTPPRVLPVFFKGSGVDDSGSVRSGTSNKSAESRSSSKRTVSFADGEALKAKASKKDSIATKEVSKRRGPDGKEYVVVSIDAQTEWSWLEDLKSMGKSPLDVPIPVGKVSRLTEESSSEESTEEEDIIDDESGTMTSKSKSVPSTPSGSLAVPDDVAVYPQASVSDAYGIPLLELSSDSEFSDDDETESEPPGEMEEEDANLVQGIGPPKILQYKRESEDQLPELDDPRSPDPDAENGGVSSYEDMFSAPCEYCGNPVKPFPTLEQQDSQPPEDLYCCDKYREFVHFTLTHPLNQEFNQDKKIDITPHPPHGSKLARKAAKERAVQRLREREMQRQQAAAAAMSTGAAPTNFFSSAVASNRISDIARQMKTINYQLSSQRCLEEGWTVRIPSPLMDDDDEPDIFLVQPLSEYGEDGDDYQFIDLMGQTQQDGDTTGRDDTNRTTDRSGKKRGLKSRDPDGKVSKSKRGDDHSGDERQGGDGPKGRAGKMTQKDKKKAASARDKSQAGDGALRGRKGAKGVKSFSLLNPEDAAMLEEAEPSHREEDSPRKQALKALAKAKRRMLRQWYYPDGTKFLTVFPDGSGNVFYPSGNVAISISLVSRGQLSYVIHDDKKETGTQMLGVFEPNGFAGCYFQNGDLRLYLDQLGGVEHDFQGGRKRRWSWKDQSVHVHAPPFQPICFSLNNRMSVRVMSQANIALTFRDKNRSCRFNVGSKLKLVNPGLIPPKEVDEDLLYINDVKAKVETLLNRVSNLLKFPKSPKLDKMKPPLHVQSMMERNEKLRNQAASKQPRKESNTTPVVTVN